MKRAWDNPTNGDVNGLASSIRQLKANNLRVKAQDLKLIIQDKYGQIARHSPALQPLSCCGTSGCCTDLEFSMIGDDYKNIEGYNPDADLGLGCGVPTQFANIKSGDAVLDLGSGAGNDCFVARAIVGESGKVTGIDFTEAMLVKATENNKKLGYANIEFIRGEIEAMPLPDETFDVVLSNCVLNLVPDKNRAFSEISRVLKSGGHFCVSDVVLKGELPARIRNSAEMYVGCVAGAISMDEYILIIADQGFEKITVHKQQEIKIPAEVLSNYLASGEISDFLNSGAGIYSITISGYRK